MFEFSLIIPCYNEEANLTILFKKLSLLTQSRNNIEIIIVNNGSTDRSSDFFKKNILSKNNQMKLIEIKKNKGYGDGIVEGVKNARGTIIAWCHADLQTEPEDALNAYLKYKSDLLHKKIIIKGKKINRNFIDTFFTFWMSIICSIFFFRNLSDINAQPKIFHKKFVALIKNPPLDFSLDLYILILAKLNNYKIISFPVKLKNRIAGEAKGGGTFSGKIKLTIRTLKYIYKLKFNKKK